MGANGGVLIDNTSWCRKLLVGTAAHPRCRFLVSFRGPRSVVEPGIGEGAWGMGTGACAVQLQASNADVEKSSGFNRALYGAISLLKKIPVYGTLRARARQTRNMQLDRIFLQKISFHAPESPRRSAFLLLEVSPASSLRFAVDIFLLVLFVAAV